MSTSKYLGYLFIDELLDLSEEIECFMSKKVLYRVDDKFDVFEAEEDTFEEKTGAMMIGLAISEALEDSVAVKRRPQ